MEMLDKLQTVRLLAAQAILCFPIGEGRFWGKEAEEKLTSTLGSLGIEVPHLVIEMAIQEAYHHNRTMARINCV